MATPPTPTPTPTPRSTAERVPEVEVVAPDRGDGDSAFAAADRALFRYGLPGPSGRELAGDPLAIDDRLAEGLATKDAASLDQALGGGVPLRRVRALRALAPVFRGAFAVAPLDPGTGRGVSVEELFDLMERFAAFRLGLARRFRRASEMAAIYGPLPGLVPPTYAAHCGLYYNRERALGFAALAHWRGAAAERRSGPLDPGVADALAATAEGAEDVAWRYEADRQEAEARRALAEQQARRQH